MRPIAVVFSGWVMPSKSTEDPAEPRKLRTASRNSSCYREIAELLAGHDAPPWLPCCLYEWAVSVELDNRIGERQPTRAEMRELLRRVREAAAFLCRALGESSIRNFLEEEPADPIQYHGLLDRYLRDLAARAVRASNSPTLADEAGKTKAGKGRAATPDALSARTYCALLIVEAWNHFRGGYPGSRNREAARAAEIFWRATGAEEIETEDDRDPLTAWRRHFDKAKAPRGGEHIRQEFRRHLEERARDWQRRSGGP